MLEAIGVKIQYLNKDKKFENVKTNRNIFIKDSDNDLIFYNSKFRTNNFIQTDWVEYYVTSKLRINSPYSLKYTNGVTYTIKEPFKYINGSITSLKIDLESLGEYYK